MFIQNAYRLNQICVFAESFLSTMNFIARVTLFFVNNSLTLNVGSPWNFYIIIFDPEVIFSSIPCLLMLTQKILLLYIKVATSHYTELCRVIA